MRIVNHVSRCVPVRHGKHVIVVLGDDDLSELLRGANRVHRRVVVLPLEHYDIGLEDIVHVRISGELHIVDPTIVKLLVWQKAPVITTAAIIREICQKFFLHLGRRRVRGPDHGPIALVLSSRSGNGAKRLRHREIRIACFFIKQYQHRQNLRYRHSLVSFRPRRTFILLLLLARLRVASW